MSIKNKRYLSLSHNMIDTISLCLVFLGIVFWLCQGLFHLDIVSDLFSRDSFLCKLIYFSTGFSAVNMLYVNFRG
jgi:uncharacterized membrane protein YuzA (DUF378 family)